MSTPVSSRLSSSPSPTAAEPARLAGLAQICLAGVLWGTGGIAVQVVREHEPMSVLTISAWRMVLSAVVLLGAALALRRLGAVRALLRAHPGRAVAVGVGTAAYQALYFGAVVATGVTVATVVSLGLAPLLLTAADAVRARRWPSAGRVLVVTAALAGLLLASTSSGPAATGPHPTPLPTPHPTLGVLLALASGTAYAAATALGRPLTQVAGPLALTATTTTVGGLALLPLGLLGAVGAPRLATTDPVAVAGLVHLGVVTMALAYALLYAGLRTTPSSSAAVATLLEPVAAAVAAALLLGERLGAGGVVGTVLVLAAVAGLRPAARGPGPQVVDSSAAAA